MNSSARVQHPGPGPGRSPSRPAYYRMHHIHMHIKQNRYPNVPKLAALLEVSLRTVERDLAYMRDMFGAPLAYDRSKRGYYYTEPAYTIPQPELTEGEVAALMVAARMLAQGYDAPSAIVAERALRRIIELLPGKIAFNPEDFQTALSFGSDGVVVIDDHLRRCFDEIMDAILGRYRVSIRYFSASRQREAYRDIEPYTLYYSAGGWYVIAYCRLRRSILLFALHRIRELEAIPRKTFTVAADYDVETYMGDAWRAFRGESMDVELEFSADVAQRAAERRWHATQEVQWGADGSLTMRLRVSGMEEIIGWVLGWGGGCRVVNPPELRDQVALEARSIAEQYVKDGAGNS